MYYPFEMQLCVPPDQSAKLKKVIKENDVSNFAILIKCTCICVFINKKKKNYFEKSIYMLIKAIY